jgi:hypothetical protein
VSIFSQFVDKIAAEDYLFSTIIDDLTIRLEGGSCKNLTFKKMVPDQPKLQKKL